VGLDGVDDRHFVWGPPKSSAGTRTVALPAFLIDVMVEHLARFSDPGIDGLVFVVPAGSPLRRENFRKRVWLPACCAVGIDGLRFHDVRHTNATLAAASGARCARSWHGSATRQLRRPSATNTPWPVRTKRSPRS
jgi:integrase